MATTQLSTRQHPLGEGAPLWIALRAVGLVIVLAFPRIPERSTIYARDGSVLATLYLDENRKIVRLNQVNPVAINAVLAIEDAKFWEHPGLDVQGILELYLNEVYFGRGVYGIGTAAEYYFGTKARNLSLPQAAMLAGLISSPETYSPVNDENAAITRRNLVIARMGSLGMVTPDEAAAATAAPLGLNLTAVGNENARFPFFVEYLKAEILSDKRFGRTERERIKTLFQGGLKIYTTLEPGLQRAGERIVARRFPDARGPQSAIAAVDTATGAVKALVGGRNFEDSQVNLATGQGGTGRQSGSAFKPFTLVAAFEQGIPLGKMYKAASGQYVRCGQYGGRYQVFNAGDGGGTGYIDMPTATQNSVNAYFVQLADEVGPPKIVEVAGRMGIRSPLEPVCSITLGTFEVTPLEMASAFGTLANHGVHCRPFAITRVEGRRKVLLRQKTGRCEQVVDRRIADDVAGLLRPGVRGGTGAAAKPGRKAVFGETRTTDDGPGVARLHADGHAGPSCQAAAGGSAATGRAGPQRRGTLQRRGHPRPGRSPLHAGDPVGAGRPAGRRGRRPIAGRGLLRRRR